jgi:hypothetical protein
MIRIKPSVWRMVYLGVLLGLVWMLFFGCATYNANNDETLQHLKDSLSQAGDNYIDSIISLYTPGKDTIIYLEKPLPEGMKLVDERVWSAIINNCTSVSLELERIVSQGNTDSVEAKKYLDMIHSLNDQILNLGIQDSINNANKPTEPIVITKPSEFTLKTFLGMAGFIVLCLILLSIIHAVVKKVKK